MMATTSVRTFLDLVKECDNFPYPGDAEYNNSLSGFYTFCITRPGNGAQSSESICVGAIKEDVVRKMPWTGAFAVSHTKREVLLGGSGGIESTALKELLDLARTEDSFLVLRGWRNELYGVLDIDRDIAMERAGSALFGIHTVGVHMMAYYRTEDEGLVMWVPRRAITKETYGGMLDNTVAGGIAAGEDPFESLVREAAEEASLPEKLIRERAVPAGTVSYIHVRDRRAGGEVGLLQPETQYVFDLELPEDVTPKPSDSEVESFSLMGVEDVKRAMLEGQFKPNCALCLVDFLIRHGSIVPQNEPQYRDIIARLHRRIDFEQLRHHINKTR